MDYSCYYAKTILVLGLKMLSMVYHWVFDFLENQTY